MATEALRVRFFAVSHRQPPQPNLVAINEATEHLIHGLQGNRTNLVKLVEAVRRGPLRILDIEAEAIIRWRRDDPRAWKLVLEWLTAMDVEVNVN